MTIGIGKWRGACACTDHVALLAKWRNFLCLHISRFDCGLLLTLTLTFTLPRFDCGLFMTGTRGELFATHVISLFIQVRSGST